MKRLSNCVTGSMKKIYKSQGCAALFFSVECFSFFEQKHLCLNNRTETHRNMMEGERWHIKAAAIREVPGVPCN